MCAAIAAITIAGPRPDCHTGPTRTSCPISAGRRHGSGAGPYRGIEGPLTTRWSRYPDPLSEALAAAGIAAGYPATDDYNGAQQEGFGRWQATIRDGRRCSASVAYLRPALARDALSVETDTLATRVVLDGRRAMGVEYLKRGARVTAHAEREVILAAGVINTPQLLMLSGSRIRICIQMTGSQKAPVQM
jgi:4-pyridoxate dehydrogenase